MSKRQRPAHQGRHHRSRYAWTTLVALVSCLVVTLLLQPVDVAAEGSETSTTTTTTTPAPDCVTTGSLTSENGTDTRHTECGTPVEVDGDLEALTQDVGPALGDRWAGAWVNPDGTITVAVTDDGALPPALTSHPKVRLVTLRHSLVRLTAAHDAVLARLNDLLAPGVEPGSTSLSPWPHTSYTDVKANIVDTLVDKKYADKRDRIEEVLADELAAGTVRITYGEVPTNTETCGPRQACVAPFRGGISNTRYATNTSPVFRT